MKKRRQTTAKPKPISAPENWQSANLTRLNEIVTSHPDWVEQTARRVGRLSVEELQKAKPTKLGAVIVLLNAQANYWRKQAARLDKPENRAKSNKQFARSIAVRIQANGESPDASKLEQELRSLNVEVGDVSSWGTVAYNWAATVHNSSALRSALDYSKSQFRLLANKEVKRLERYFGSKSKPMSIERSGQTTIYSPMVAGGLLLHKLAKMSSATRGELIELLLQIGKLPPPLRKFLSPRRS